MASPFARLGDLSPCNGPSRWFRLARARRAVGQDHASSSRMFRWGRYETPWTSPRRVGVGRAGELGHVGRVAVASCRRAYVWHRTPTWFGRATFQRFQCALRGDGTSGAPQLVEMFQIVPVCSSANGSRDAPLTWHHGGGPTVTVTDRVRRCHVQFAAIRRGSRCLLPVSLFPLACRSNRALLGLLADVEARPTRHAKGGAHGRIS